MTPRQQAASFLEFSRWYADNLMKDFPEDRLTYQPSPTDNHLLWVMGHLAGTDAWIGGVVGAPINVPDNIQKAFGMGSKPASTGNPPASEVKKAFVESRAALLNWLKSAPDSALAMDLKEKTGGFAADPIDAMLKIAWHEGFHFGQVANIRKALGLPPTM
ncbi:MAG: DinB family protein [Phycisphaerae bacterium]|nr:DinB family protein [Phycisphaerae bacterium]